MTFIKNDPNINRKGRPKGSGKNQLFDALLEMDSTITRADIVKRIWGLVNDPKTDEKTKLTALAKLVDYTFEKPKETIEITEFQETPMNTKFKDE